MANAWRTLREIMQIWFHSHHRAGSLNFLDMFKKFKLRALGGRNLGGQIWYPIREVLRTLRVVCELVTNSAKLGRRTAKSCVFVCFFFPYSRLFAAWSENHLTHLSHFINLIRADRCQGTVLENLPWYEVSYFLWNIGL